MKYCMLLWPHANSRYQDAVKGLAQKELQIVCNTESAFETIGASEWLVFEAENAAHLSSLAHMYLVCEMHDGGLLKPVIAPQKAFLGSDLGGILKYKGKTNEVFTRFLLNIALASSAFSDEVGEALSVLDPMCGKGTTLFESLNRGWNAFGIDMDKNDIAEANTFFKKYLEYHKIKHKQQDNARTIPSGGALQIKGTRFTRENETRELSFAVSDSAKGLTALQKESFHLCVCDLPYGVQHAPGGKDSFEKLLMNVLPGIHRVLKRGGAAAFSFNVNTLKRETVMQCLAKCGFTVRDEENYRGMAHFVEQSVTRDVCVGVKEETHGA